MAYQKITSSKHIHAPTDRVYGIIADYREGHSQILPKPYFESLVVEKGGVGAGTVIRFQMTVMGKRQEFRAEVSEPEPGCRLVERDLDKGNETIFQLEPSLAGGTTQVTITTIIKIRDGVAGLVEGWLSKRLLSPIYEKELDLLALAAEKE